MRVITGTARGRKLKEPKGNAIRPTTDLVKEAVFNIVQFDIEGRTVLDLFAGSGNLLKVDADLRKALTADEYGTLGVGLGGSTISSDAQGYAHFDGKAMSVMPYVGLGLGRAIGDGRVKVTFDLGAAVDGGIKLQSYNYVRNTLSSTNPVETVQITSSTLSNKDKGWVDKIGKIPVFPMLKFGIYVRLF